jgi:zinc protease
MIRKLAFALALCVCTSAAYASSVQEVISPKGFKAWLVEEHSLPLVAIRIAFKGSGFAYDPKGREGRASLTAAMLMEGAGDMNQLAWSEALESHAMQMNTSADEDTLDLSMETLGEHKDLAFSYLGLAMTKPRFDGSAIERGQKQFISLLTKKEQQPGYLLEKAWKKAAFGSHPYANDQLGNPDSVDDLSASDLRYVTEHYLTKENIVIAVVGDITPADLSRLMDAHFSGLPEKYAPDVTLTDVQIAGDDGPIVIEHGIPQTIVFFGGQGLKRNDPDYFTGYVMNHILGGGSLTSLLATEIRERRGLTYSVSSQMQPLKHASTWRGAFSTRNDQLRTAVNVMLATLEAFAAKGPTDDEVRDAKSYIVDSFALNLDGNADLANFLINMQVNNLGIDYMERRKSLIEAVRKEDIEDMAKRLIDTEKMLLLMIGKPPPAAPLAIQIAPASADEKPQ